MIRGLYFDIDHTLMSERPMMALFLPQVYEKLAKKLGVSRDKARELFLREIVLRRDSYEWHDWNFFFGLFGLDMRYERLIERYPHRITVFPDVVPALEVLRKRYLLGIITSGPEYQRLKLKVTGLLKYFDVIVTREDAKTVKPDPKIFLMALEMAGLKPNEAVMVGDSLWQDVYGAKNVGMKAVWINRNGERDFHMADFTVRNLHELIKLLGVGT